MRYVDRQRASDGFFPPGRRHYWKAGWQRRLAPAAIDVIVEFAVRPPVAIYEALPPADARCGCTGAADRDRICPPS
jgi:hypothetical protein